MKIKRKTKIQQGDNVLHTTIPLTVVEMLGLKKGDSLEWEVTNGRASFQKQSPSYKNKETGHI